MKNNVVLTRSQAMDVLAALESANALIAAADFDGSEVMIQLELTEAIEFLTDRLFPNLPEA